MGPKKKKNNNSKSKPNGYYLFMLDYQKQRAPNKSLAELSNICSPLWQDLSQQRKAEFNNRAKDMKQGEKDAAGGICTSSGILLSQHEAEAQEATDKVNTMERETEEMVTSCSLQELLKRKFVLIHINKYCKLEGHEIVPAEIGIVEFTIRDGIKNHYQVFVGVPGIPAGYRHHSVVERDNVHGIPLPAFEEAEPDIPRILNQIKRHMQADYPDKHRGIQGFFDPLFTVADELETVENGLEYMLNLAPEFEHDMELFRVYKLEKLFLMLNNATAPNEDRTFKLSDVAEVLMKSTKFEFAEGTGCKWHNDNSEDRVLTCSLAVVQRWAFIMAEYTCINQGIDPIEGKHVPLPPNLVLMVDARTNAMVCRRREDVNNHSSTRKESSSSEDEPEKDTWQKVSTQSHQGGRRKGNQSNEDKMNGQFGKMQFQAIPPARNHVPDPPMGACGFTPPQVPPQPIRGAYHAPNVPLPGWGMFRGRGQSCPEDNLTEDNFPPLGAPGPARAPAPRAMGRGATAFLGNQGRGSRPVGGFRDFGSDQPTPSNFDDDESHSSLSSSVGRGYRRN